MLYDELMHVLRMKHYSSEDVAIAQVLDEFTFVSGLPKDHIIELTMLHGISIWSARIFYYTFGRLPSKAESVVIAKLGGQEAVRFLQNQYLASSLKLNQI